MEKTPARQSQNDVMRAKAPVRTENQPVREDPAAAMQRALGNQAMQRMLESRAVQAKLEVTPPGDAYEQEAERVAGEVMGTSHSATNAAVQRKPVISRLGQEVQRADTKDDKKKQTDTKSGGKKDEGKKKDEVAKKDDDSKKKDDGKKKEEPKKKEDDKVKRAVDDKKEDEEKDPLQRAAEGAVPEVSSGLEHSLNAQRKDGQPLPDTLRSFYEPRFGRDLSSVRIHNDSRAAKAAQDLKAQAFTRGNDVYFASGKYQPDSDSGRKLLAHELTHTIQQSGGQTARPSQSPQAQGPATSGAVHRAAPASIISRQPSTPGPTDTTPQGGGAPAANMTKATGILDEPSSTITYDDIGVPSFKTAAHRGALYASRKGNLIRRAKYTRGNTGQRDLWKDGMGEQTAGTEKKLEERYKKAYPDPKAAAPSTYIFQSPEKGQPRTYIGDLKTVAREMTLPYWTRSGDYRTYDVDHIVELQLANWGEDGWANTLPNMELLDSKLNSSSGGTIEKNIEAKANAFNKATQNQYGDSADAIKSKYHMKFDKVSPESGSDLVPQVEYWSQDHIKAGEQVIDQIGVRTADKLGDANHALIFPGASGTPKQFSTGGVTSSEANWLKPYILTEKNLKTDDASKDSPDFGTLTFTIPKDHKDWQPTTTSKVIDVTRVPGAQYAGIIDKAAVRDDLRTWRKTGLSPIEISEFEITPDQGIYVHGQIKPDLSLLAGIGIDFELSNGNLTFFKEFSVGDFKVPKPFTVTDSTLKVSAGVNTGITIDGKVNFKIEKVGDGYLGASVGTSTGFGLEGGFNFDPSLFAPPARIDMSYKDDQFKASGVLTIPPDKVRGIKKATITATYESNAFKATGDAELDIPGVQKASMEVGYSEKDGLDIKGKADLKDDIPGIKGGSVSAEVKQGDGGWKVSASGTAKSTIVGIDADLQASYDDGAFTIQATASYARGFASGTITLGATNRGLDDKGNPAGDPGDTLKAFGSGTVTLQLTSWLKGTVGVQIKPEGGLILSGEVGLPSTVDVFAQQKVETTLLSIGTEIPIIPGIVARIGGRLAAEASFGPGQLRDLSVKVTYDPDHEEDTEIQGTVKFYVPAQAGLTIAASAGLGIGITGASATGNLEVAGTLGIGGAAEAQADVDWTPKKGFDLKASADVKAQPVFTFDINGVLLVTALGATLYEKRWNLAKFEYGSNLTFGIEFPIHYHEGEPFNVSVDDIKFIKPDIDVNDIVHGLISKIV